MATSLQGAIRSRFQFLSRELSFGKVQCPQITWCLFQSLLGRGKGGAITPNEMLLNRRLAGSHLDIKTQFRKSPSQMARFSRLPVLHINATFNNTVITIADKKGSTLGWVSAGTEGFKNARRGSSTAGRQAGIAAAYKAISMGIDKARVKVRGIGMGRQGAVNGIESSGLTIVSVTDVTPVPHNGCRPRKTRRL